MDIDTITAFIAGVAIPAFIVLFGREALGKWLLAGQVRENTALDALIEIVKESIAGWRESSSAITRLVTALEVNQVDANQSRHHIQETMEKQYKLLHTVEGRLSALLLILSETTNG